MRPRRKRKFRRRTPPPHLHIPLSPMPHRHRSVRNIRHRQHEFAQRLIQFRNAQIRPLDLLRHILHSRQNRRSIAPGFLRPRNLLRSEIAFRLKLLSRSNQQTPRRINLPEPSQIEQTPAVPQHSFDEFEVPAKKSQINHRLRRIPEPAIAEKRRGSEIALRRANRASLTETPYD